MSSSPDDPERKCSISKSVRLRVAAEHDEVLRYGGMTAREWAAAKQWGVAETTRENAVAREKSTFAGAIQTKVGASV